MLPQRRASQARDWRASEPAARRGATARSLRKSHPRGKRRLPRCRITDGRPGWLLTVPSFVPSPAISSFVSSFPRWWSCPAAGRPDTRSRRFRLKRQRPRRGAGRCVPRPRVTFGRHRRLRRTRRTASRETALLVCGYAFSASTISVSNRAVRTRSNRSRLPLRADAAGAPTLGTHLMAKTKSAASVTMICMASRQLVESGRLVGAHVEGDIARRVVACERAARGRADEGSVARYRHVLPDAVVPE